MAEIKPKNIFEVQCRDDVPTKKNEGRDVRLLIIVVLPAKSTSIFLCPNCYLCTGGMKYRLIFYMYNTNE